MPATDGSKVVPLTPVPLKVPPVGVPDNDIGLSVIQSVLVETLIETEGFAFTVTVIVCTPEVPHPFVPLIDITPPEEPTVALILSELLLPPHPAGSDQL
jgi:hypothetical protein